MGACLVQRDLESHPGINTVQAPSLLFVKRFLAKLLCWSFQAHPSCGATRTLSTQSSQNGKVDTNLYTLHKVENTTISQLSQTQRIFEAIDWNEV